MGVDAEMFIRVRGRDQWLSEDRVRSLAWALAGTMGHDRFMIHRPREGGPGRHCLSIVEPFVDEYDEAPGLIGRRVIQQDAPPIVAADDEQFIRVHLFGRYYGKGYERGDWPFLRSVMEWLEVCIPGCEVWYGGDSSGVEHQHYGPVERADLNRHFLLYGHRPYLSGFGFMAGEAPRCSFCKEPMIHSGGGGGLGVPGAYDLFRCTGCGEQVVRDDVRLVRYEPSEKNAMHSFCETRPDKTSGEQDSIKCLARCSSTTWTISRRWRTSFMSALMANITGSLTGRIRRS